MDKRRGDNMKNITRIVKVSFIFLCFCLFVSNFAICERKIDVFTTSRLEAHSDNWNNEEAKFESAAYMYNILFLTSEIRKDMTGNLGYINKEMII